MDEQREDIMDFIGDSLERITGYDFDCNMPEDDDMCRTRRVLLREAINYIKHTLVSNLGKSERLVYDCLLSTKTGYSEPFGNFNRRKSSQLATLILYVSKNYRKDVIDMKPTESLRYLFGLGDMMIVPSLRSSSDWHKVMFALGKDLSRPSINKIKKEFND